MNIKLTEEIIGLLRRRKELKSKMINPYTKKISDTEANISDIEGKLKKQNNLLEDYKQRSKEFNKSTKKKEQKEYDDINDKLVDMIDPRLNKDLSTIDITDLICNDTKLISTSELRAEINKIYEGEEDIGKLRPVKSML